MGLRKNKSLVDQAIDQAGGYVDALRPHVESALDQAKDFVQDTAIPALSDARDKAVPGHQLWTRLNHHRVPMFSVLFMATMALLVTLPALIGDENNFTYAFAAVVSIASAVSYALVRADAYDEIGARQV